MDCRHISGSDVADLLREGKINSQKSDPSVTPCPKYVVDARVGRPSRNIQGVFSSCLGFTNVVTVIDRDKNWTCYCP
ncbi:hypothetical protein WJX73_010870 [Symbiochloris irregularis]|uniref:Uncharacterized protein n=1 Tax=Symbiochloris irregularis TaxID=706552 RepID=A0AAW1PBF7_9CHLO